jgi:hypothetical protein
MTNQSSQVGKWFNASKTKKGYANSLMRQWSLRLGMVVAGDKENKV